LENHRRDSGQSRITKNREERYPLLLVLRDPFDTSRSVGTHWSIHTYRNTKDSFFWVFCISPNSAISLVGVVPVQGTMANRMTASLIPGVMVWNVIHHGNRSPLVFIPGNLNAHRYINDFLEPVTLQYLR
ncbi:hypothetical protein BDFB_014290, partial [Asbolus verrucosus]